MKKLLILFVFAAAFSACGNNENDSKKEANASNDQKFDSTDLENDTKFAVAAADGGMLEVALGKLAQTNASSTTVKQFGQMMVDDHSKAGEELKSLAASKNITLPSALSNKNQDHYNDLAKKMGKDFDKAYSSFMVDDHKEDIDEFKKQAEKGKDGDLKNWAAGKVPVLEHHLMMAQAADSVARKN
jgi:putative membrane protein